MARIPVVSAGLKLCEPLICAGLKAVLQIPEGAVDAGVRWLKGRFTDHSLALTRAVSTAHDRAWQAVALALATDTVFSHVANLFRDGDLKAVQKQIREFVATADTGLDGSPAGVRAKACNELLALKKAGRFGLDGADLASLDLTRFASAAKVADGAHRAVQHISTDLTADAPHLAQVLILTPPAGGTPLLAAAFAYFLRREIATNAELARELLYDGVRLLTLKQQAGFGSLERVIEGKWETLTGLLSDGFAPLNAKVDSSNAKLDEVIRVLHVVTEARNPLKVSVRNEQEKRLVTDLLQQVRALPPELLTSDMLSRLGDALAAAGEFKEAARAQQAAADAAREGADRQAEADAAYKQFKAECESGRWDSALAALKRAIALDDRRFRPVPRHYAIDGILGAGSFGVVLKCRDTTEKDEDGNHLVVAVKTFRETDLELPLDELFAEASVLKRLAHENIVGIHERGFADPENQRGPFLAMEFVPGVTLEHYLDTHGVLNVADFTAIFCQIAAALHAAHSGRRPVIHRDLKPANVMVWKTSIRFFAGCWGWRGLASTFFGSPLPLHGWGGDSLMGLHLGLLIGVDDQEERASELVNQLRHDPAVRSELTRELNSLHPPHLRGGESGDQPPYDIQSQEEAIEAGARLALSKLPPPDEEAWYVKVIDFGLAVRGTTRAASLSVSPTHRTSRDLSVAGTMKYAAPEQLGERSYPVGPHSDVYAFGKTALEALLGTTQPTPKHWKKLPEWLADLLARCVDEDYFADNPDEGRFHGFAPILEALMAATPPTPSSTPPPPSAPAKHRYTCHECLFQWDIPVPRGGELATCPSCVTKFVLKPEDRGATSSESAPPPKTAVSTKLRTSCPLCRAKFRFPPKRAGDRAKCPQCGMWLLMPTQDGGYAIVCPTPTPESPRPALRAGDKFYLPLPGGLSMPFAWCPPGTFLMGSPEWEGERRDDELQHEVRLSRGFYCGVHPVTQAHWEAVMDSNPSHFEGAELPVETVSWDEAEEFCVKVSRHTNRTVRLPTEAEWEYACRGGTTTPFYWGEDLGGIQANCGDERPYGAELGVFRDLPPGGTTPVGAYAERWPHPWGLTDVHGNVWEWCADYYDPGYYANSPTVDPQCRQRGHEYRVLRGGSWISDAEHCRAACRWWNESGPRCNAYGFRAVFGL